MYLGDNLLKQGAKPLIQVFEETRCDCLVGAAKVKDPSRYGIVAFNKDGSIGDHVTLLNTEIENSIVMNGARIDCGKKITDSLIGKDVEILDSAHRLPEGHRLIVGDSSKVTL
jgi:glucose-1-phosphate thymidylyltransferase